MRSAVAAPAWRRSMSLRRSPCATPSIRSLRWITSSAPHLGYVSRDEYEVQFTDIFDQITAYAAGTPINVVNPDVLARARRGHTEMRFGSRVATIASSCPRLSRASTSLLVSYQ